MKKLIFKKFTKDISLFFFILIISVATIVWIIQAVNYLDLISEDGHSLRVYFSYTLFSLPKIISKILPFIFMISLFYIIINYEINNELIIFWINGVTKLAFINLLIKISIIYFFLQIILTTVIVPYTLDKGRSYFRTSEIDLFSSIIKEKKFIDSVEDLTIFVENKNLNLLENIIIKEKINENETQIIFAQNGEILNNQSVGNKIILKNGKIINTKNDDQNIIDFSKFNLDLGKFNTNTITHPKTQEMNTFNLIQCMKKIFDHEKTVSHQDDDILFFVGCNYRISNAIFEEFLKRFFAPIFIIIIGLTSSLIITSSKDENFYKSKNIFKFLIGVAFVFLSEILMTYSGLNINNLVFYFFIPLLIFLIMYFYLYLNLNNKRRG